MQQEYKKVKPSMHILQETLDKIDAIKAIDHTVSGRGEIVDKAVDFYKSHLDLKQDIDYIAPVIKSIMESTMAVYFERVNRNLFKLAVEQGVNSRCLSKIFEIDEDSYQRARKLSVDDVKRIKGTLSILDAQE